MLILPQNSPSTDPLAASLHRLRARIAAAAAAAGRSEDQVTLVAVSKGQPEPQLRAAARLGLEHFAESYLQEALPKLDALFSRGGHALVVVGAAHLVGPDGLLAMFKAKGYKIEQL